jgi:hypothetical protein
VAPGGNVPKCAGAVAAVATFFVVAGVGPGVPAGPEVGPGVVDHSELADGIAPAATRAGSASLLLDALAVSSAPATMRTSTPATVVAGHTYGRIDTCATIGANCTWVNLR